MGDCDDNDMLLHQFQAAATGDAAAGSNSRPHCFFLGVSLLASSPAMLLAAAAATCAMMIYIVVLIKGRRKRSNQQQAPVLLPPPPGRGSSSCWWWYWSVVVETLAFVAANSSGRGFYHFVEARHRRYGRPGFRTALFGHTHVFVSSADAARSLLASEHRGFSKRYVRTVADLLGEHSLLCASHDAHRSLRRAIAPLFNAQATASLAASFDALTRHLIMRDWSSSSGSAVVVLDAALGITFDAICDMLIATLQPDAKRQLQSDVLAVTQAMLAVPLRLPGTRFYAGLQARRRIMEVLRKEIDNRRRSKQQQQQDGDFLQSLLVLTSETDDQLILDNILTLIIAGQVTTATRNYMDGQVLGRQQRLPRNLKVGPVGEAPGRFPHYASTSQHHGARIHGGERITEDGQHSFLVSKGRARGLPGCRVSHQQGLDCKR
ncbi:hypothetical protein BS78_K282700 [Paspalum vaginatum]|uniref:Cytochrome P450 n=1 Tax=Paspalum vaginatum TaxID=158149 RepID=A0A9W8CEG5_9POAL|nr:hypothetical protein BS78_K282700 [Paspalum vaginatum]